MDNKSIAECADIKTERLSHMVTCMLAVNAVGVTVTVGLLDTQSNELERIALMILIFSAATAVALFFLANRYVETVNQSASIVDPNDMDDIIKATKRFFTPFVVCLVANILVALTGAVFLSIAILGM